MSSNQNNQSARYETVSGELFTLTYGAIVAQIVRDYEDPKEVVRWFYSDPNRLKDIESAVLEANVIKYVSELGTVTDKPVTFEELSKLGQ